MILARPMYAHSEPPVSDVCSGGSGAEEPAGAGKKALAVVARKRRRRIHAPPARPVDRAAVDERSRGARRTILAVGARREKSEPGLSVQNDRRAERGLEIAAALSARTPERDGRLAARQEDVSGLDPQQPLRQATARHPRFPIEPARRSPGPEAQPDRLAGRACDPDPVRPDDAGDVAAPRANRGTRPDERRPVSGHVGEDERHDPRGSRPAELSALDRGKRSPQPVDLADRRARPNPARDRTLLLCQRHAGTRQAQKRGSASGDQAQDDVLPAELREETHGRARRGNARSVGIGVRREEDRGSTAPGSGIATRKHDETPPAASGGGLEHPCGGFARREDTHAAGAPQRPHHGRIVEGSRDGPTRIDRRERGPVQTAQERARLLVHPNVILVRNTIRDPERPGHPRSTKEKA
jgi:hypothetical protein